MAVFVDQPGSVIRYGRDDYDVEPPYSAEEQARDAWLDAYPEELMP